MSYGEVYRKEFEAMEEEWSMCIEPNYSSLRKYSLRLLNYIDFLEKEVNK